uniref:Uncharacterized protein n=1 Tax=Oryza sativa subsp. japonica TaxID=39947 RepID=Q33AM8_ORYSJ|nr:hypothetical protein LOC_Os10g09150 [Oryza sativa Japonica Group]
MGPRSDPAATVGKKPDLAAAAEDVGVGSGSGEDAVAVRAGRSSGDGEDAAALHAGGEAKSTRGGGGAKSSRVEEERSLRVESCGGFAKVVHELPLAEGIGKTVLSQLKWLLISELFLFYVWLLLLVLTREFCRDTSLLFDISSADLW